MDDVSRTLDLRRRQNLGFMAAAYLFVLTELVFTVSYDWGFLIGIIPAVIVAASVGWISHRFLWIGVAVVGVMDTLFVSLW